LTQQLTATGTFSDSSTADITGSVTWSSSDPARVTLATGGLATAVSQGSATVTADAGGGISASTVMTVTAPVLATITVTPTNPSRAKGLTLQLTATGVLTDLSTTDLTASAVWSSAAASFVTVDAAGLVTAQAVGSSTVSATVGAVSGSTSFTVTPAEIASIAVTPPTPTVPKGRAQGFVATATLTDATTQDVTGTAAWMSSAPGVATVAAGLAATLAEGNTTISASQAGRSGSALLTVGPAVVDSIAITGAATFAAGTSTRLVATGTRSDSSAQDVTALATWASDAPAVALAADVPGLRGLVTGASAGAANVSATLGTVVGTAAVQVRATNAPYSGRCGTRLVISQLFGGGGNTGAPFRNDYVELHNAGVTPRSLNGMSLQYTSDVGTSWASNVRPLPNVTLEPGGYFLVQLNVNGTVGAQLSADFTTAAQLNIAAGAGKLALVSSTVGMPATACPDATAIDFVGYGGTASCAEGAPAPAPSNTTALFRGASGCRDGDANAGDLTTGAPAPRSAAATAPVLCSCTVNETDLPEEAQYCNLQFPSAFTKQQGAVSDAIFARVYHAGLTEPAGSDPSITVEVGFGSGGVFTWWPASFNVQVGNDDEYQGLFLTPAAGTWDYTARTTRDGVHWTLCDLNGAGSNAGLTYEPGQLGVLTSTP
jgi:hypothetical protein